MRGRCNLASFCFRIIELESEVDTIDAVMEIICATDPDVLIGYEVQMESIGYLADRCKAIGQSPPFLCTISREKSGKVENDGSTGTER